MKDTSDAPTGEQQSHSDAPEAPSGEQESGRLASDAPIKEPSDQDASDAMSSEFQSGTEAYDSPETQDPEAWAILQPIEPALTVLYRTTPNSTPPPNASLRAKSQMTLVKERIGVIGLHIITQIKDRPDKGAMELRCW